MKCCMALPNALASERQMPFHIYRHMQCVQERIGFSTHELCARQRPKLILWQFDLGSSIFDFPFIFCASRTLKRIFPSCEARRAERRPSCAAPTQPGHLVLSTPNVSLSRSPFFPFLLLSSPFLPQFPFSLPSFTSISRWSPLSSPSGSQSASATTP